jgi:putative restriction endonuclease
MADLKYYIHCFKNLRRDRKNGGAPHKPVLLLSVIDLFEKGIITSTRIYITPELVGSFKSHWSELVATNHQMIFALPFYHLGSEPFWNLVANTGCERWVESKSSMRSILNLTTAVSNALIDKDLFEFFLENESRNILKMTLLEEYFAETKEKFGKGGNYFLDDLAYEILEELPDEYRQKIITLKEKLNEDAYEEEVFVRSGIFKREVPKLYDNACAISGLRIDTTLDISMVDACHIIPFAESYNDTITNGIALCPNLHRAFDRGLISLSENYRVLVSTRIKESHSSPYNLGQFNGLTIRLPRNPKYLPAQDNLAWHRKKFGF